MFGIYGLIINFGALYYIFGMCDKNYIKTHTFTVALEENKIKYLKLLINYSLILCFFIKNGIIFLMPDIFLRICFEN